jgi:hypothetical protein
VIRADWPSNSVDTGTFVALPGGVPANVPRERLGAEWSGQYNV